MNELNQVGDIGTLALTAFGITEIIKGRGRLTGTMVQVIAFFVAVGMGFLREASRGGVWTQERLTVTAAQSVLAALTSFGVHNMRQPAAPGVLAGRSTDDET